MRTFGDYFCIYLKGAAMGAADLVPGVSGGTIAFITGIYTELLDSLRKLPRVLLQKPSTVKLLWEQINGTFLLCLALGMASSLLALSKVLGQLLTTAPEKLWAFFFGLVCASAISLIYKLKNPSLKLLLPGACGLAFALAVNSLPISPGSHNLSIIFFSGAIAVCAMILPGISGAFILLLLGMYQVMIQALQDSQVLILAVFLSGCLIGLLSFAQILSHFLKRFPQGTMALLTGFMLGSLPKLWPWKQTLVWDNTNPSKAIALVQENLSPQAYEAIVGRPHQLVWCLVLASVGLVLVLGIELRSKSR